MLELSFEKEVVKTLTTGSNQMGGTQRPVWCDAGSIMG